MPIIKKLFFSPVKSLSFQKISKCKIVKNVGIFNDRLFAFSRNSNLEKARILEKNSFSRNHKDFLSLKNTTVLNKYKFTLINNILTLHYKKDKILSINIENKNEYEAMCNNLVEVEKKILKPVYLLRNEKFPFFDTTHSKQTHNTISLINLNSIKELSNKLNIKIEYERFRGNIYIDNLNAWDERKWIDKIITINNTKFLVDTHIPRCSATNLKPNSDKNTINLPQAIRKKYNHADMGVYLKPLENGSIKINDKIILS
tara:strand:+ start:2260 stop:3033 length:774 start_codon:yes stop_codon:yes gene_type:complete